MAHYAYVELNTEPTAGENTVFSITVRNAGGIEGTLQVWHRGILFVPRHGKGLARRRRFQDGLLEWKDLTEYTRQQECKDRETDAEHTREVRRKNRAARSSG